MIPLVAAVIGAALIVRPWEDEVLPTMRPSQRPELVRSLSVDFATITDPDTDWGEVDDRFDSVGATAAELSAGRVEFTAFDWAEHPEDAAEPGTDHLAKAARALVQTADGEPRQLGLIVDAYVPEWIKEDPSIAGVSADGRRSAYQASATQLTTGAVGRRLVDYVAALGERYDPASISITELFLSSSFGDDDLELFEEMTGQTGWPRTATGELDPDAPSVTAWRSAVVSGVLQRMRAALDRVRDGDGAAIELAMDVRVNWGDPAAGVPASGHGYRSLLRAADLLVVWAYLYQDRPPSAVRRLTSGLIAGGLDISRFAVSVGLWADGPNDDPREAITPARMAAAVRAAGANGVTNVNVTPYSLMTAEHWKALAWVWQGS
ncbi:hypothetical protein [Nocardioides houyundeii]|uniref:hypothetical protein n=1 Tax=Nocardioides houyundeii TaxID=2045452 RepID=UPI0019649359|nr:hypothetical protein [Nocardioides houyundeii]